MPTLPHSWDHCHIHRSARVDRMYHVYQTNRAGWVMVLCLGALTFALLVGATFLAPAARADGGVAQFSIRPAAPGFDSAGSAPYFVLNLTPGATMQSRVRITNIGTAAGRLALYPVDATTGQTSGVVYYTQNDPRADVGRWITVDAHQLSLDPGKSQIVTFTVSVPHSARPGQHVGGLVAENLAVQGSSGSSVAINIQHLSIVAVQVNLPGKAIQRMEATGIRAGGQQGYQILYMSLRNSGTQMLKPSGSLQVTDMAGHQLKHMTMTLDTVLPQTAISYPVYVYGQALGPGRYRAVLSLTYGNPQQTLSRTFTFEITAASVQQVFGNRATNAPPPVGVSWGGNPSLLPIAGGIAALLLAGFGASLFVVPRLRLRLRSRKR